MMKVLELYSGIGGMHYALTGAGIQHEVIAALDVNDIANTVYRWNFQATPCLNRAIESLTMKELRRSFEADLWTMSPPCQPFTRFGKQEDTRDKRTNSFMHLLRLIPQAKPKYILLENVKGFDTSEACQQLLDVLDTCGYSYQQFLLSPYQFGVPNSRLRYYLAARRDGPNFHWSVDGDRRDVISTPPQNALPRIGCECPACQDLTKHITQPDPNFDLYAPLCPPLSHFLCDLSKEEEDNLLVSDALLAKGFRAMDLVKANDRKSNCFTKSYCRKLDGAGSFLMTGDQIESKAKLDDYKKDETNDENLLEYARSLRLRAFSEREIANLMCFPPQFDFPETVTRRQRLRLLGNSINVLVVAHVLHWLISEES